MADIRKAQITRRSGRPTVDEVRPYLPANYAVVYHDASKIIISGEDSAGWTMRDYVVPRLASGLICAEEGCAMDRLVTVTALDVEGQVFPPMATVLLFTGTDVHTGDRVTFGADHRPASEMLSLIGERGELDCAIESWQICRVESCLARGMSWPTASARQPTLSGYSS